jgi:signal transduction histidine kinase/tetratricopeptide (TPR) repeat protein
MRSWCVWLIASSFWGNIYVGNAQKLASADTLQLSFVKSPANTLQVDRLNRLTSELYEKDQEGAFQANARAVALAQADQYLEGLDLAYNHQTVLFMARANYSAALQAALKCRSFALQTNNLRQLALAYNNLGTIYKFKGDYKNAMGYFTQSLRAHEQANDTLGTGITYNYIGDIYTYQKNYQLGLDNYRLALQFAERADSKPHIVQNLVDIGRAHQLMSLPGEAKAYYEKALEMGQGSPTYKTDEAKAYLAEIYANSGDSKLAVEYMAQALARAQATSNRHNLMLLSYQAAVVYAKLGRDYQAVRSAAKTWEMATKAGNKLLARETSQLLAELYLKRNNLDKDRFFQEQFIVYRDSLQAEERSQELAQKEAFFELEQEKRKNELLRKDSELKEARLERSLLVVVLALLALTCLFAATWLFYRQGWRERQNNLHLTQLNHELTESRGEVQQLNNNLEQLAQERTQELSRTVDQLTARNQDLQQFSFILSHNIRLPIAQVLGLVQLIQMTGPHSPETMEIIGHMGRAGHNLDEVVKDLNVILTVGRGMEHTQEVVSLPQVFQQVLGLLAGEIELTGATIDADFSGGGNLLAVKFYVHNIVYNLLSNAIKYRSPKRQAHIKVATSQVGGYWCLSVTDNGLGIDLANTDPYKIFGLYQRMHTHTEGKGLGLYMTKAQVEAMQGRIEVSSEVDIGTQFRVFLPFILLATEQDQRPSLVEVAPPLAKKPTLSLSF